MKGPSTKVWSALQQKPGRDGETSWAGITIPTSEGAGKGSSFQNLVRAETVGEGYPQDGSLL